MTPEDPNRTPLNALAPARRDFVRKLVIGTAFAVPTVASFSVRDLAYAQVGSGFERSTATIPPFTTSTLSLPGTTFTGSTTTIPTTTFTGSYTTFIGSPNTKTTISFP